jgi:hypothetical protein
MERRKGSELIENKDQCSGKKGTGNEGDKLTLPSSVSPKLTPNLDLASADSIVIQVCTALTFKLACKRWVT